jgi:leucyl aminopeptidase (aminopeptidase T)
MTANGDFQQAVATVVRRCLAVEHGERVVVVADPPTQHLGEAFRDEATAAGAEAELRLMDVTAADGAEPPQEVAEALAGADVFLAPTTHSLSHTEARRHASERGARGATLPGVSEDMLARLMSVDFDALGERCRHVADLLTKAHDARVTCPRGTDLRLDLRHRGGLSDDGDLSSPGAFGNLPCGEGFISPHGAEGILFAKTFAAHGIADEPLEVEVRHDHLVRADGELGQRLFDALEAHGREARTIAELGVGTNDHARITGNVLEDEKILGTVHVAFGASKSMGGNVQVPIHLDLVVLDATLDIGKTRVLDEGRWVL